MHISEMVGELNQGVRARYLEGNPLELTLYGHHPAFIVEERRDGYLEFDQLLSDSINLVGSHALRNLVTFGDANQDEADVVVIYDGTYYYRNMIFGSFISPKALNTISRDLQLPYTFSES